MRRRRGGESNEKRSGAVVGYVRVSTEDQATKGVSLDAQRARIEAYAVATEVVLTEIVVDHGVSAKTLIRPGLTKVLNGVRSGTTSMVVAVKLDRLTRSTRDLSELLELFQRSGAALVSVSESLDTASAAGRMVVNMLGVVAQWEREAIGERTSIALAHKRSNGQVYGPTPFGYRRRGSELFPNHRALEARAHAQLMDREGASYREIARYLTASGVAPHRGKAWYASTARAMLRSKIAQELEAK